jgi:TPR repeat protein
MCHDGLARVRILCDANDPRALSMMGNRYACGFSGITKDVKAAVPYFTRYILVHCYLGISALLS